MGFGRFQAVILVVVFSGFLLSCSGGDGDMKERVEVQKKYMEQAKKEFERDIDSKLDSIEQRIAELDAKVQEIEAEARPELHGELDRLEDRLEHLENKIGKLEGAGRTTLEKAKGK